MDNRKVFLMLTAKQFEEFGITQINLSSEMMTERIAN